MNAHKLILGTAQMGLEYGIANNSGQIGVDEARNILAFARNCGIDTLDTAADYGESESTLGLLGMAHWHVVTKLRPVPDHCHDVNEWVRAEVEDSLERLGTDELYGLLLHKPHQLLGPIGDAIYSVLMELKYEGKVNKIGASIYGPDELDAIFPLYTLDLIQGTYNLFDRRLCTSGWLDECQSRGVEVHVRSVFLQGALLMPRERRPAMFDRWKDLWARYDYWLAEHGYNPLHACLGFALAESRINRVVVGVDNLEQLRHLVEAAKSIPISEVPEIGSEDLNLINPSRWKQQ